jgi:predicted PurR-regulated permease PerM
MIIGIIAAYILAWAVCYLGLRNNTRGAATLTLTLLTMFFLPIFILVAIWIWSLIFPYSVSYDPLSGDPRGLFALAAILIIDGIFAIIATALLLWITFQMFEKWKESRTRGSRVPSTRCRVP